MLYGWLNQDANHPDGFEINISKDHQVQIALAHQRNFGDLPDQATMDRLIAAELKSEIYYREALRLGLDENDEIVRRRLKQKYEFLNKDNATVETPSEEALRSFYKENQSSYLQPARYSFEHYYFSPDKRSSPSSDATNFINNPRLLSDPFHIASPKLNKTIDELRNDFGLSFANGIMDQSAIDQLFQIESGFGHHAVRMISITPAAPMTFDDVKDQLVDHYRTFILSERNKEAYEELKQEYTIDIESID